MTAVARRQARKPPGRPPRRFRPEKKSRLGLWTAAALLVLLGGYLGVLELSRPHVDGDPLRFDVFVDLVETDGIRDARVLDQDSYVVGSYVREDGTVARYNTPLVAGTQGTLLVDVLSPNRIPTTVDQQVSKRVASLASILLPGLILIVLFVYLILSYRRGTGLFGVRSGARQIAADDSGVGFADIAGQDAAVAELREIKDFLADPDRFNAMGAQVPKGVLLYGPPGCGKTMLAKALAAEAGAAFYSISGSDFVELYVGVGASRVRDLFKVARENAPSLIFIDELDSVGRARSAGGGPGSHTEQEQALNQILAEMDGFSTSDGILLVAATNRADVLDPALLRPGRFDRTVALERPDEAARLAILSVHARTKRLDPAADLKRVANRAIGLTGADLAGVMNEAALRAVRGGRPLITQTDLDAALQHLLEAPERQRRLSLRDRSIGKRFSAEDRITFADVAGVDEALVELAEVKDYLANPERFARLGARVPRGILLSGPPGCGKTLLGRAVAGEANAAFISVAGSEFVEIFVGEGASRVRELFAEARSVAPAIVFIDEIDAIGSHRGGMGDGSREREQTLNQILVELDGFEARGGVIVMGATNRPDVLDSALVRPGRFDRRVEVTLPDRAGRRAILEIHAGDKPLASDVSLDAVAGLCRGFSGADLANVVNEAALLATRRGLDQISMKVMDDAIDRALLGVSSGRHIMSDEERLIVAYHEAGHALVALVLPGASPPHRLTIAPRGGSLGHCTMLETHDRLLRSRSTLVDEMAALLGGRVAERAMCDDPGTAAADDLRRVYAIARAMVCDLGMSEAIGPLAFGDDVDRNGRHRAYSERHAELIEAEIRRLVDEAYERADLVLRQRRPALQRVAEGLLAQETISAEELWALAGASRGATSVGGRPSAARLVGSVARRVRMPPGPPL
ncbi:MAG: ATP-dependent zinc metalloprotease FtsH [Acidimicrobiales bacterium]